MELVQGLAAGRNAEMAKMKGHLLKEAKKNREMTKKLVHQQEWKGADGAKHKQVYLDSMDRQDKLNELIRLSDESEGGMSESVLKGLRSFEQEEVLEQEKTEFMEKYPEARHLDNFLTSTRHESKEVRAYFGGENAKKYKDTLKMVKLGADVMKIGGHGVLTGEARYSDAGKGVSTLADRKSSGHNSGYGGGYGGSGYGSSSSGYGGGYGGGGYGNSSNGSRSGGYGSSSGGRDDRRGGSDRRDDRR